MTFVALPSVCREQSIRAAAIVRRRADAASPVGRRVAPDEEDTNVDRQDERALEEEPLIHAQALRTESWAISLHHFYLIRT